MFRHPDPEVLVVGAGPVGLVAALFLQQHGVGVEVVDTHQRTTQHSYALAIHPRTLRILDEAGLSEIDYAALASEHPYLLILRQSLLERAAEEALRQKKLKVLWGHRLQSLDADDATPRVEVAKLDQVATGYPVARTEWVVVRSETIRPAYVIGADGYDSAVRRMAGIEMEEHGAGQIFSVYEIEAAGELPAEVRVILDPGLTSVYWPLEEGRCRWGLQIQDASGHEASMERLEQLIAARAPWCTARPTQIYWSTLGLFESRVTRSFGKGGVWLAGDAAHQAAPVGVHSMNSGLMEARELAARMMRILRAGGRVATRGVRDRNARGVAMAPRRLHPTARITRGGDPGRPGGARASGRGPLGPGGPGEDRRLHSGLGRRVRTAAPADRPHGRAVRRDAGPGPPPPRSGFGEVSPERA
ncbi:MAG: hypothetical protein EXQ53_04735 [Acidobacteria bacterium]|nr:hypothetical protein [Acidobacteriota bacterium]